MAALRCPLKLWSVLATLLIVAVAFGQHKIVAGEYKSLEGDVSLLVARPSGKNWTVRGTIFPGDDGSFTVSGTLYEATGKLLLKGPDRSTVDGAYSTGQGTLTIKVTLPSGEILTRTCHPAMNIETVWALEPGYPKTPEKTDENIKLVTIDGFAGTLTWNDYAKKDGNVVPQTFKFYVPKSTYRPGEIFEWFADGSSTEHTALPVTGMLMRAAYVNRPNQSPYYAVVGTDSSGSGYNISVGWRSTQKLTIFPPNGKNDRFRIVVGIVGDVLEWWYKPEMRLKGAKETAPAKPAKDTNTTTKPPKDVDDSGGATPSTAPTSVTASQVTGDVSFRTTGGGSDYKPLTAGTVLNDKMEIDVDPDGSATLKLPNGGSITIKGGTRLRLEDLTSTGGQARVVVRLLMGEILYRHAANAAATAVRGDFVLHMNESVTSSLGTEFSAKFDPKTNMLTIDLREGKLEFKPAKNIEPILLNAPTVFSFLTPPPR